MKAVMLSLSLAAGTALVSAAAARPPAGTPEPTWQSPDGKVLYLKNCRQCHGATGEPSDQSKHKYPKIVAFTDAAFFKQRSDDSLRTVVAKGKGRDMKGFSDKLTKEEIGAVVEYIHTLAKPK